MLEALSKYRWRFSLLCNLANHAQTRFVEGWVVRDTPSPVLKSQLEAADSRERIALYAANGFWYDTLSAIISVSNAYAQLRPKSPLDGTPSADWASVLHSVGLDEITRAPIVTCCTR